MNDRDELVLQVFAQMGRVFADMAMLATKRSGGVHLVVKPGLSEPVVIDNVGDVYVYLPEPTELQPLQAISQALTTATLITTESVAWDHDAAFNAWNASRTHALYAERLLTCMLAKQLLAAADELD